MFKDEILENSSRHKIYMMIKKNPGLHLRELQRTVDIPLATLQYHLNYMVRRNIIIEEKSEHYTRYYVSALETEDKKLLSILRNGRLRDIVMIILVNEKAKYQFLLETLKLPASTISFYLKYLVDNDVIERTRIGYENIYTLKNQERVEKILVSYQSSLLDKVVDKWTRTWLENHQPKEKPE